MSARSGLVGKNASRPYLGPSEAIFSIGRKNPKNAKILPIFLGGPNPRLYCLSIKACLTFIVYLYPRQDWIAAQAACLPADANMTNIINVCMFLWPMV